MGPSRHTRAAAAASASSSSRNDESAPASTLTTTAPSASRTPTRASPYARTPTKPSSALTGPSTPTSRTSSPMMLREIFSMISPFRGHSRARRSAAFGGADEADAEEEHVKKIADGNAASPSSKLEDVDEAVDTEDRMIEDAEEGVAAAVASSSPQPSQPSRLAVPSSGRSASRSPSPKPRSSMPAPLRSLPLADSALVTPGLRRQFTHAQPEPIASTLAPSTSYAPPTQTSPVSRNYDLLARFFSEKQRGGQGGLTEVEVEGCIRLIEESMATGRNLESEFTGASSYGRPYPPVQTSGFAPSSRASSIAPPAMPSSQSMNNLFHPGTNRMPASSSAYSFLAPRAPAPQSGFGGTAAPTRRRPIYLGPGMSGLSLNRRRPVVASASRASALAKTQAQGGFMPRSSTDPNLARHTRDADETQDASDRAEEAKRRRTAAAADVGSPAQDRDFAADQTAQFEPAYEKQARQSSLLAKDIAASSTNGTSSSPFKRAAPAAESAGLASTKASPPKAPTRTASAIQDILKTTPPVRPPTKPELVNPYQSAASLAAKSKKTAEEEATATTPVRRSARASMLTRAKARETQKAAEKSSPPKESVLDLIERTAPKTASKRKAAVEKSEPQHNGKIAAPEPVSAVTPASAAEPSVEERKLQKTEEVQRRLEALTKAKNQQQQQQQQQSASKPAAAEKTTKPTSSLVVPPQYTASKPKKPSPLSAAFQAPDSPSSDSEAAAPVQPRGPTIAQPSFSFGSPAASTAKAPLSGFSFSAPKPSTSTPAPAAAAAPSTGFSFSKPAASAAPVTSAAPAAAPSSSSCSFSPVAAAPAAQKPATAAPLTGFSFSTPSVSTSTAPSLTTAAAGSGLSSSPRGEVSAEDVSKLPKFDWQVPAVSAATNAGADKALRDEIKSVAQAALPKFDFVYDIETTSSAGDKKVETANVAPAKAAPAPVGGFSFSATAQPTPAAAPAATETADSTEDASSSADDPSKTSSSGLLGEGEGEESESTLFEARAKIWRLDMETKAWKDLGICIAKLKHDSSTGKHRLLARNEANGKVAVNFMTYKGLKSTLDKTVNSFLGFDGKDPTQYRVKVKTEDMAKELKEVLEEAAAKA
ncbi:uncharacterized protein UTRI_03149_B [Ustilago trichophora]|uniref:RanBD1 domain-containing protein n=1 Tax=Ustilago trichophora TaxID=86804 RepID=A0A5C3E411_9BASI|nr:uncharacterized protein UTRI_03149_B [Ustilago trichophora]